jgi:hypothetical protein
MDPRGVRVLWEGVGGELLQLTRSGILKLVDEFGFEKEEKTVLIVKCSQDALDAAPERRPRSIFRQGWHAEILSSSGLAYQGSVALNTSPVLLNNGWACGARSDRGICCGFI